MLDGKLGILPILPSADNRVCYGASIGSLRLCLRRFLSIL